ncbi:unnamed protein product [Calypogeia fissa]
MANIGQQGDEGWRERLSEAWATRRLRIAENCRFWALVEPYRPPPRLMPLLLLNVAAFYTGVVGAAITEQLYKEKYWDEHPGAAVPIMRPLFYIGPYKVTREDFSEENAG